MSQKKKDIAQKTFIALNDVFADIFNVLLFEGKLCRGLFCKRTE